MSLAAGAIGAGRLCVTDAVDCTLKRGVKKIFTVDVRLQRLLRALIFWARYVQECLKRRPLLLQVQESADAVGDSSCVLLRVPWSESEEV